MNMADDISRSSGPIARSAAICAATIVAALALVALAAARGTAAGKASAAARAIKAELQDGQLAKELAAEREYRAALGALVADAAGRSPQEPSATAGFRQVRDSALRVAEEEVPFASPDATAFVESIEDALSRGGVAVAVSADAMPGGRLRGVLTIRRFFLP